MDRGQTENAGCAASSVDGVSGNEEEHVGVTAGDSNSSLDALHIPGKVERKRGRFGALRRSFKKDGGIFSTKKKPCGTSADQRAEEPVKGGGQGGSEKSGREKNSKFLGRKLSLHKFKSSPADQEALQPSAGGRGDGSRSPSQSSQDSRNQSGSPRTLADGSWGTQRTGMDADAEKIERVGEERAATTTRKGERRETDRSAAAASEVERLEKPVSTITVVQRKSPSLTIKSIPKPDKLSKLHVGSCEKVTQTYDDAAERTHRAVSTLPYAISKWPEIGEHRSSTEVAYAEHAQPWRKISSLDEKRAVFQRRRIETSRDSSTDTLLPISIDEARSYDAARPSGATTKRKARHISVTKFDTFSTFEGTFDENTGIGYLQGIDEDATLNLDSPNPRLTSAPSSLISVMEKSRSTSQESAASQNNGPTAGLGERREHLYKILVIGELGAGKTSIIKRYVHQFFSQHYRATIGVDFALKVLNWDPHTIIRLQLWDIAGQERFGNMTRVYYKEAVGAFIVFDVTRSATLDAVVKWKQDLDSKVQLPDGSAIPCVLLANKCDQQKEGLVNSPNKMDEYCEEKNFSGWFETSAKENVNIEEAAKFLVNKILQNDQIMKGNGAQEQTDGERFALNQSPTNTKKSCSC